MAELTEKDKISLLGANYKEIEAQARAASGISVDQRASDEKQKSLKNYRNTAAIVLVLAGIVYVTDRMGVSGPYNSMLSLAAMGTFAVALVAAILSHLGMQKEAGRRRNLAG